MKNNKKRIPPYVRSIYSILMLIACIFMSVGYASMNTINMQIVGSGLALEQKGMIITEVKYKENTNADIEKSKINQTTGSILNSTIALSNSSPTSSITYTITIYNNNGYDSLFKSARFDETFYDNNNITFELSDTLSLDTLVKDKSSITFDITFKYKTEVTPSASTNTLNSYINFQFVRAPYILSSYSTSGSYTYTIPEDGIYRIQLWGASGSGSTATIGNGGYVQGDIELQKDTILHIYVGGKGTALSSAEKGTNDGGGFNGGGNASNTDYPYQSRYGGGGATDIRIIGGEWNNFESLKSRILVAGGGGSYSQTPGGHSGGLNGYGDTGEAAGSGGTQTAGGLNKESTTYKEQATPGGFGYGGNGGSYSSGGGSGYYGGGGGMRAKTDGGGGGGSSFISGHEGCDAIDEQSTEQNIIHTGQSIHYSGYYFTNTLMIDGNGYQWTNEIQSSKIGIPDYTGTNTLASTPRNGYAIIKIVPTK